MGEGDWLIAFHHHRVDPEFSPIAMIGSPLTWTPNGTSARLRLQVQLIYIFAKDAGKCLVLLPTHLLSYLAKAVMAALKRMNSKDNLKLHLQRLEFLHCNPRTYMMISWTIVEALVVDTNKVLSTNYYKDLDFHTKNWNYKRHYFKLRRMQ